MDNKVYSVICNKSHLEHPFDICSKAYTNQDNFQTHLRQAHGTNFKDAEDTLGLNANEKF